MVRWLNDFTKLHPLFQTKHTSELGCIWSLKGSLLSFEIAQETVVCQEYKEENKNYKSKQMLITVGQKCLPISIFSGTFFERFVG